MWSSNSAGFSRLLGIWGITLIIVGIGLVVTFYLISQSKQPAMPLPPPPLPAAARPQATPPSQNVNLFLLESDTFKLVPVKVDLRLFPGDIKRLKQIVTALIEAVPPRFRNPIPRGTLVHEVYIDNQGTAYLDFSQHLSEGHIGGTHAEFLTVTAILKTVFDAFPADIKQVQFLIDGNPVETLAGHVNLSQPLRF